MRINSTSRVIDGNGEAEQYQCACLLAQMVGIQIDDGDDQNLDTRQIRIR